MALITEVPLEQQALDQVVLFQVADGQVTLNVRLEADTVWLSQAQLAELFGREQQRPVEWCNSGGAAPA
jgi:hypothetical protein